MGTLVHTPLRRSRCESEGMPEKEQQPVTISATVVHGRLDFLNSPLPTEHKYSKGAVGTIEKVCRLSKNHGALAIRVARHLDVNQQEADIAMSEKLAASSRFPAPSANFI